MPGIEQVGGHQVVDVSGEIIGTTPLDKQVVSAAPSPGTSSDNMGVGTPPIDTSYAANMGIQQHGGGGTQGLGGPARDDPAVGQDHGTGGALGLLLPL